MWTGSLWLRSEISAASKFWTKWKAILSSFIPTIWFRPWPDVRWYWLQYRSVGNASKSNNFDMTMMLRGKKKPVLGKRKNHSNPSYLSISRIYPSLKYFNLLNVHLFYFCIICHSTTRTGSTELQSYSHTHYCLLISPIFPLTTTLLRMPFDAALVWFFFK